MVRDTYSAAGVDIDRADRFVERLKAAARRDGHERLWPAAGGYAAVYPLSDDHGVAVTTDGVGTKLLVASKLACHDTIGIDLVAMCANDLVCVGARPQAFLDYFATGRLDDSVADAVLAGIIKGCDQAGMILIGGETAEMPGVYGEGHYDLCGFAMGEVKREGLLTGEKIEAGQTVIGLPSSGIHANGLSLARRLIPESGWSDLIIPTAIYARPVTSALSQFAGAITGLAHITGGGWANMLRLKASAGYHIESPLPVPPIFSKIGESVDDEEMYRTFNMGMGMVVVVRDAAREIVDHFCALGLPAQVVGSVTAAAGTISISGSKVVLRG